MKRFSNILLFIFTAFLLSSCSTCKIYTKSKISEVEFGHGGGFTNKIEKFSLNSKGELRKNGKVIGKASCEDVERIFLMADDLDSPIYEPDNFYWFITVNGEENQKYLWGSSAYVDRKLKNIYNELIILLK